MQSFRREGLRFGGLLREEVRNRQLWLSILLLAFIWLLFPFTVVGAIWVVSAFGTWPCWILSLTIFLGFAALLRLAKRARNQKRELGAWPKHYHLKFVGLLGIVHLGCVGLATAVCFAQSTRQQAQDAWSGVQKLPLRVLLGGGADARRD